MLNQDFLTLKGIQFATILLGCSPWTLRLLQVNLGTETEVEAMDDTLRAEATRSVERPKRDILDFLLKEKEKFLVFFFYFAVEKWEKRWPRFYNFILKDLLPWLEIVPEYLWTDIDFSCRWLSNFFQKYKIWELQIHSKENCFISLT